MYRFVPALLMLACCSKVLALPVSVEVGATKTIWLANQPDGTSFNYGLLDDVAPQASPILINLQDFSDLLPLHFSVLGSTSRNPDPSRYPLVGPDGETPGTGPNAIENFNSDGYPSGQVSSMTGPLASLVGVFFNTSSVGLNPTALDFGTTPSRGFLSFSPLLQQVFFIGDGLTGIGTGQAQSFYIPGNADTLFLGIFDVGNGNNVGSLDVSIFQLTQILNPLLATTPADGGIVDFGNVLVGSSAIESISAINVGDPGSTLNGLFPAASGDFGPGSTSGFSLPQGSSTSRDYSYTPAARGNDSQDITVTSNGGDSTISLTGNGVAPVQDITHTDAPLTRIGTSSTLPPEIVIANIGDGNLSGLGPISNLNGTIDTGTDSRFVGGGSSFSLTDHTSQSVPITYTPTGHTTDASVFEIDITLDAQLPDSVSVEVEGRGVGPTYESNPPAGGTVDFGPVNLDTAETEVLIITNSSTDPNGGDSTLTDLTLLSAVIAGPDAEEFALIGFVPGTVLSQMELINLLIEFSPQFGPGSKEATLTFFTDEGAAFGSPGLSFSYSLRGAATPEPTSLLGFGVVGLVGVLMWRRGSRFQVARS